jgi:hypothetical protein
MMECPHCKNQVHVAATVPDEQKFIMRLESQAEHFSAETIGGVITDMVTLLKSAAESAGGKVHVFISGMETKPHHVSIEFFITSVKQDTSAGRGDSSAAKASPAS